MDEVLATLLFSPDVTRPYRVLPRYMGREMERFFLSRGIGLVTQARPEVRG